ncbi:Eae protein [Salmonella enterica subsp. enterica]|uniref:Eae protein n=1 Tax=Salmonella enterica I TaxID=59201 RepID=A0A379VMI6_SALET|nr:Eae protein [Salmonella enterica subsp. enterica]
MGSNIIELAKLGHERAAELKGSYEAINACSVVKPDGKEMSVNRYEFEDYGTNEPDGRYVTYEDYSASEARCAALSAKLRMINDLTEAAEQANKLAQEAVETLVQERNALAAENSALKKSEAEFNEYCRRECEDVGDTWVDDFTETRRQTPFWLRCGLVLVTRASTMPPAASLPHSITDSSINLYQKFST